MEELEELLEISVGPKEVQDQLEDLAREDPSQFKPEVIQLLNYARYVRANKINERCPTPSKISISTVSSVGIISGSRVLDLELLSKLLSEDIGEDGYFIDAIGLKKKKGGGEFGNSINLKLRGDPDRKIVNVILSQNGRMTLTGSDDLEYGKICMERLLREIKFFPDTFYNVSPQTISIESCDITMINTDYSLDFEVDQIRLYEILVKEYPYLVTFNPEIYPGICVHYMWNKIPFPSNGVCNCSESCLNRKNNKKNGNGKGSNDCREITCAIFETGKVLITGSNSLEQVNDVYTHINQLLKNHYEEIVNFTIKKFPADHIIEVN